ncbi:hypothetical protein AbraIFM66951_008168 [Aspergillus brasiliensis]|nr:hypothetical protein AbraIFM66951_008168 [Aspergillus brasiliensis]
MTGNLAALIPSEKCQVQVVPVPVPHPGPSDLLVRNLSIALNPVEAKMQAFAYIKASYPLNPGLTFAGVVEQVGSAVSGFEVGDHVAVVAPLDSGNEYRSFQQRVLAQERVTSRLKPGTRLEDAAALIGNLATVVGALNIVLGLERPALEGSSPAKGKKIFIYGGSSNVGILAIQYAALAGYTVISTTSAPKRPFLERLGAVQLIDRTLVAEELAAQIINEGPYDYIFDSIGTLEVTELIGHVVAAQGGGTFCSTGRAPCVLPPNVTKLNDAFPALLLDPGNDSIRRWFYEDFFPLAVSTLITPPPSEKVPGGLAVVQGCLDRLLAGTSGSKLLIDPWSYL